MFRSSASLVLAVVPLAAALTGCSGYVEERVVVREPSAVVVAEAPPPPRTEVIVAAPSPRHHWQAGHWVRSRHEWVWVSGRWRA
jgi:hypothetical protein